MAQNNYTLIVVGVGGTGSRFLREATQFLAYSGEKSRITSIHLFDGDEVEEKNLRNQGFMREDIGMKKAAVLSEIYSEFLPFPIQAHCQYLSSIEPLEQIALRDRNSIPVLFGCVDNHGCRLLMEDYFNKAQSCILFDSGNEFDTGEVVYAYKRDGKVFGPPRSFYFPDIKNGDLRNREEMSCEELNVVSPQHFLTNGVAASYLLKGLILLLQGQAIPGFQMFNALKMGFERFVPLSQITGEKQEVKTRDAKKRMRENI